MTSNGDVIFLGTGVSTALPRIPCLLKLQGGNAETTCAVCMDAWRNPGSSPNHRGNVSIAVRPRGEEGDVIVIDCGKTFREAALRWFPEHRIRRVDALLVTHGHFDAIGGMDELREFQEFKAERDEQGNLLAFRSVHGAIPIYLTETTMQTCRGVYPYLMPTPKEKWDGEQGNDVPRRTAALEWVVYDEEARELSVKDTLVRPLPVLHGGSYICMGFGFGQNMQVVILTDVKSVPSRTMDRIRQNPIHLLVVDTLQRSSRSNSHFGLDEALALIGDLRPQKSLLVGMSCELGDHHHVNEELRLRTEQRESAIFGLDIRLAHDGLCVPVRF